MHSPIISKKITWPSPMMRNFVYLLIQNCDGFFFLFKHTAYKLRRKSLFLKNKVVQQNTGNEKNFNCDTQQCQLYILSMLSSADD